MGGKEGSEPAGKRQIYQSRNRRKKSSSPRKTKGFKGALGSTRLEKHFTRRGEGPNDPLQGGGAIVIRVGNYLEKKERDYTWAPKQKSHLEETFSHGKGHQPKKKVNLLSRRRGNSFAAEEARREC